MPKESPSRRPYRVKKTAELRALASPARQEFVTGLLALQPCTMSELGQHLGRLPVSLYYHLRKLQEVGLVVTDSERETERGTESLYRLRSRDVHIDPEQRSGANLVALRKIGAGIFRLATRLHDAAVADRPAPGAGRRKHVLSQRTVRLSAAGLRRVNARLDELLEVVEEETLAEGRAFYTLTMHLAPNHVRGERMSRED